MVLLASYFIHNNNTERGLLSCGGATHREVVMQQCQCINVDQGTVVRHMFHVVVDRRVERGEMIDVSEMKVEVVDRG